VVPIPVITAQPVSIEVLPKTSATVSAGLTATDDTKFQWYYQADEEKPWVAIPGSNKSTYVIGSVSSQDTGYYRLEVANSAGTIASESAYIRVSNQRV